VGRATEIYLELVAYTWASAHFLFDAIARIVHILAVIEIFLEARAHSQPTISKLIGLPKVVGVLRVEVETEARISVNIAIVWVETLICHMGCHATPSALPLILATLATTAPGH
jgi:hypothetical protein